MPIRVLEKDKSKNDRNDQAKQQSAMAQKQETPKPQKLNSKGSEKANEPKSPSARRDERKAEQREQRIMLREYGMKRGGLKGNQKKLDKNNNNRIDAQDFKILKAEKAKDRGMGLQDEKMKPGKVMKADKGEFIKRRKEIAKGFGKTFGVFPKINKQSMGQAKDYKKYLEGLKQATMDKKANKALDKGKKIIGKGGRIGAAAALLGLAGAGAAKIGQTIGRKIDEAKKKNKKMGGGMMKKYDKGGMSASEKFKTEVKAIKETIDDKNTPMKADRMTSGLKAAYKKAFPKKKMGGGMMMRPTNYSEGGDAQRSPTAEQARRMGQRKTKPGRRAGVPSLPGKDKKKKQMFVILGENKKYSGGQGGLERDADNNPYRYSYDADPFLKDKTIVRVTNKSIGGSVTVKTKLGRNKPTKMY